MTTLFILFAITSNDSSTQQLKSVFAGAWTNAERIKMFSAVQASFIIKRVSITASFGNVDDVVRYVY